MCLQLGSVHALSQLGPATIVRLEILLSNFQLIKLKIRKFNDLPNTSRHKQNLKTDAFDF